MISAEFCILFAIDLDLDAVQIHVVLFYFQSYLPVHLSIKKAYADVLEGMTSLLNWYYIAWLIFIGTQGNAL